jgi:hypothetical protein
MIEAVEIEGRDELSGGGILSERFLRLRSRLPGESGRRWGRSDVILERLLCAVESA